MGDKFSPHLHNMSHDDDHPDVVLQRHMTHAISVPQKSKLFL